MVAAIGLLGLVAVVDASAAATEEERPADRARPPTATTERQETDTAGPEEQLTEAAAGTWPRPGSRGSSYSATAAAGLPERRAPVARGAAGADRRRVPALAHAGEPIGRGRRDDRPARTAIVAECTDGGVVEFTSEGSMAGARLVPACVDARRAADRVWRAESSGEVESAASGGAFGTATASRSSRAGRPAARSSAGCRGRWATRRSARPRGSTNDRVALVVHDGAQNLDALAVFRGRELLGAPPFLYDSLSGLRTSPRGGHASALLGRAGARPRRRERRVRAAPLPRRDGHRLVAGRALDGHREPRGDLHLRDGDARRARSVFVPIQATDLVWIGP